MFRSNRLAQLEKVIFDTEDGFIIKHPTMEELKDAKVEAYDQMRTIIGLD